MHDDLQALIDHAGSGSRLWPVPVKPAELSLRALELARLSPLAEWHYKTAHKDSFVSIEKARELLGWEPRLSNAETLCATYDWYLAHLDAMRGAGTTHRVPVGPAGARAAQADRLIRSLRRLRACRATRSRTGSRSRAVSSLRCWDPRDAPLLKDAVDSSLEHLREWMPWAHDEPEELAEKVVLLRRFRGNFDLGQDFVFGIFSPDESEVLGGTGLHTRTGEGAFEIGYWVRANRTRHGIATAATAALTRAGIEVGGADRIEIHVDPGNEPSLRIPRRLGFHEEGLLRRRLPAHEGPRRDAVIFSLLAEDLAASPAAQIRFEAFDCRGLPLAGPESRD